MASQDRVANLRAEVNPCLANSSGGVLVPHTESQTLEPRGDDTLEIVHSDCKETFRRCMSGSIRI